MKHFENLMRDCIELAKQGYGKVSPNPLVGCIILDKNGKKIADGYHKAYGQNHAERDALLKLENAKESTLIVNLEPCSHHGKTPPCTDLIIEKGIKTVVYGMKDPNPKVNGLAKLKTAGIEIIGPVLEDECKKINEVFIKNFKDKKTFVALKTATTIDGKIATHSGDSKWITSEKARAEVRNIRKKYDAVLTSSSTVIADNPTMEHNKKIILDRELKTDLHSNIYNQGEIFIFNSKENKDISEHIHYIKTPNQNNKSDIEFILDKLFELGIMSVLVEAGGKLNSSFLPYIDKLYHFTAPKILSDNSGKSCFSGLMKDKISECINLEYQSTEIFTPDILNIYTKNNI